MANWLKKNDDELEEEKTPSRSLRKEQKALIEILAELEEAGDKASEQYRNILNRIETIDNILDKRKNTRINLLKAGGGLLLGGAGLALAYRNDKSEYPTNNKGAKGFFDKILGNLLKF